MTGKVWKERNAERYVMVGGKVCIPTQWSTMCKLLESGTVNILFDGVGTSSNFSLYSKFVVTPGSVGAEDMFENYRIAVRMTGVPSFESGEF